jgi:hypothetical protein
MAATNVQAFSGDVEITSNLAVNTDDLFVDTVSGRVGIGTTIPEVPFHIDTSGYLRNNYIHKFLGNGPEQAATYVLLLKNDNTPKSLSGKVYGVRGSSSVSTNFGATLYVSVTTNGTIDARMTFEHIGAASFYCKLVTLTYDSGSYIALALLPTINYRGVSGGIYFDGKLTSGDDLQYITDLGTLSNITDYTATNEDRITFTGNVGIGTTNPQYKLDVSGSLAQSGQKIYPERRWEVDLSSGTSTSYFYPLYLETDAFDANIGPYMFPVTFNVIGEAIGGDEPYNEETLVGYARGGGATDHVGMCKVHSRRYQGNEFRCLGIWEGTANQLGIVIYLRGGYKYSLLTNATNVVVNTSSYFNSNSTWAVKNASKTDVVGTSANINELQNVSSFAEMGEINSFTGSLVLPNSFQRLGVGTGNPQAVLHAVSSPGSETVLRLQSTRGDQPSLFHYWSGTNAENFIMSDGDATGYFYGRKYTTGTSPNSNAGWRFYGSGNLGIRINSAGNVGIGQDSPNYKLDVPLGNQVFLNGVRFFTFGSNTANTVIDSGIPMKGYAGGGSVLLFFSFHNSGGDYTRTDAYILRKSYDASWVSDSTSVHTICSLRGTNSQTGTLTFGFNGSHLTCTYNQGGAQNYYALSFDNF